MRIPDNAQKEAIIHLSGPAMITAGPGSGKTYVIINRILYLICHHHIRPDNILVITYTKAAANEMKERYEKACCPDRDSFSMFSLAGKTSRGVYFGTFHSICYHILRQSGRIRADSLIRESDRRKLLEILLGNRGLSSEYNYDMVTELLNIISRMKNFSTKSREEDLQVFLAGNFPPEISGPKLQVLKADYDEYLREQGLIDFDDMIGECLRLLADRPAVLEKYRQLFQYILVDEFQDINFPQYEIVKLLAAPHSNLFVVGDDDQAIYGFRGATPGIMKRFLCDYKEARQVMMTDNYRCQEAIVTLSERVISQNKERFVKKFQPVNKGGSVSALCFNSRREEEQALLEALTTLNKNQLLNTAVILRTNREAAQYSGLLKESGIPVKGYDISLEDIYHGFIMKDITAFLCYLYEGTKRSDFICFMNRPNHFLARGALPFEKVEQKQMEQYYDKNPEMLLKVAVLFRQLEIAAGLSPYLAVRFFRKTWGYDNYLRQRTADYKEYQRLLTQADNVQECFRGLKHSMSVRRFVENQAEKAGKLQMEMRDGVSILTMHGSKGLEFESVFLPDVNEGIIPGKNIVTEAALEEERRLLYVAMTRARQRLYIYCTKERGRKPSRYLEGFVDWENYASSSVSSSPSSISSNSALSRYSSKASDTISYSSSSSM